MDTHEDMGWTETERLWDPTMTASGAGWSAFLALRERKSRAGEGKSGIKEGGRDGEGCFYVYIV